MKEGLDIVVTPSNTQTSFIDTLKSCTEDVLSICLYAVSGLELTDKVMFSLYCHDLSTCSLWLG